MNFLERRIDYLETEVGDLSARVSDLVCEIRDLGCRGVHDEPRFISTAKAGKMLGVSTSTINRWIRVGELPAKRVGRSYIIAIKDIDRLFERKSDDGVRDPG